MKRHVGKVAGKIAGRLSLSISRKMLLTAVVSLGAVSLLSLLHLQLGWVVSEKMGESDHYRQISDSLVVMRTAVLQSELVVKDAVGRRADFSKANLSDLAIARKDFERESRKAADFMRDSSKALGDRDAGREFAELNRLIQEAIRPAIKRTISPRWPARPASTTPRPARSTRCSRPWPTCRRPRCGATSRHRDRDRQGRPRQSRDLRRRADHPRPAAVLQHAQHSAAAEAAHAGDAAPGRGRHRHRDPRPRAPRRDRCHGGDRRGLPRQYPRRCMRSSASVRRPSSAPRRSAAH